MKTVRHFGIVVSNLEKSLHFYKDILGLKIQRDMLEEGKFVDDILGLQDVKVRTIKMSADEGNTLVELLWYQSHLGRKKEDKKIFDIGPSHLALTIDNLENLYQKLKSEGVKFNCPPQVSPDGKAKVVYCYDFEGNPIELVEELS